MRNIRLQLAFRKASSHSGIGCLLEGFSRRDRKGRTKKMATPEVRGVSGVAASKRRCGRSKEFRGEVDNPLTTKSEVFKQFFSHRHWDDPQRLRRDHVRPKACAVYEDQGDRGWRGGGGLDVVDQNTVKNMAPLGSWGRGRR